MTDNELLLALSDMMDKKLDSKLQPIKNDIRDLKQDVTELKQDVCELKQEVIVLRQDVDELKQEVIVLRQDVDELKQEVIVLRQDVDGLKQDVVILRQDVCTLKFDSENMIKPQIQLLAENYMPAAKKYEIESSKIASMQDDIHLIKKVVTEHSKKIQRMA